MKGVDVTRCTIKILSLYLEKSSNYAFKLSQKSNFQPSTTKPDNIGYPTVETGQIWPSGVVFKVVLYF